MISEPRKFYDSTYHYEQDIARPDEQRIWRAMRWLEPIRDAALLDLGCGAGWAARMATLRGAHPVAGVDFSGTALRHAAGHSPQVHWIQADGNALPLGDQSFDRIFCNGALEHFPDVRRGLKEIDRLLRSSGKAVLIVPNFYVRTEQPMEFRTSWWTWRKLIEESGLRVRRTGTDWGPRVFGDLNPVRILARLAGKMLGLVPFMQYQFVFVVEKP